MFERFTERARQVVVHAQEVARSQGAEAITTGHLLIGVLREEEGLAARVLASRDITEERVFGAGEWPSGPAVTGQVPFESKAKKVIEYALREALSLGHNYIGTEHVLLGLIRSVDEPSDASRILEALGVASEQVREDVIRLLSGPQRKEQVVAFDPSRVRRLSLDDGDYSVIIWALGVAAVMPGPKAQRARDLLGLFEGEDNLAAQIADLTRRLGQLEHFRLSA